MATKKKARARGKAKTKSEKPAKEYKHLAARSESEQISPLAEDLQDAWARLKEVLLGFGEQKSYTSHRAIMFSRRICYLFVRPKKAHLEVTFFLREKIRSPLLKGVTAVSKTKHAHTALLKHRDQVEPPLADWFAEAYAQGV